MLVGVFFITHCPKGFPVATILVTLSQEPKISTVNVLKGESEAFSLELPFYKFISQTGQMCNRAVRDCVHYFTVVLYTTHLKLWNALKSQCESKGFFLIIERNWLPFFVLLKTAWEKLVPTRTQILSFLDVINQQTVQRSCRVSGVHTTQKISPILVHANPRKMSQSLYYAPNDEKHVSHKIKK